MKNRKNKKQHSIIDRYSEEQKQALIDEYSGTQNRQKPLYRNYLEDTPKYKAKSALIEMNIEHGKGMEIFGCLKLNRTSEDTAISRVNADKILKRFWNKIDRIYYPRHAVDRGIRVKRLVFWHKGIFQNPHYHFLAEAQNGDIDETIAVMKRTWWLTDDRTNKMDSWIDQRREDAGAAAYLAHEADTLGTDTLMADISVIETPKVAPRRFQTPKQQLRVENALFGKETSHEPLPDAAYENLLADTQNIKWR